MLLANFKRKRFKEALRESQGNAQGRLDHHALDGAQGNGFNCALEIAAIAVFDSLSCHGQIAQLVEQGTENPRVGSSILPLATIQLILNTLTTCPTSHFL